MAEVDNLEDDLRSILANDGEEDTGAPDPNLPFLGDAPYSKNIEDRRTTLNDDPSQPGRSVQPKYDYNIHGGWDRINNAWHFADGGAVPDEDDWEDVQPQEQAAPQPQAAAAPDQQDDWKDVGDDWADVKPESSAGGAFIRGAERGALPAVGGLVGAGLGAEALGGIGLAAGPVGGIVGGIVGGAVGALGGGFLVQKMQDAVKGMIGLGDDVQEQADAAQHPYASMAGEMAPNLIAFQPGRTAAIASRVAGGAIMGGLEAGQEAATQGEVDPTKVLMAGAFGAIANEPTRAGNALLGAGARLAPRAGRPDLAGTVDTAAKAEAAQSVANGATSVSVGTAEAKPAPSGDGATIGNIESRPTEDGGNDGRWSKKGGASGGATTSFGDMDPTVLATLQASVEANRKVPVATPAPEDAPNQPTGLVEAAAEHAAKQAPQQAGDDTLAAAQRLREAETAVHDKVRAGQGAEANVEPAGPLNPDRAASPQTPESTPAPGEVPASAARAVNVEHPFMPDVEVVKADLPPGYVARSDNAGMKVYVSPNIPERMDVNGHVFNPADPLKVHEIYERNGIAHIQQEIAAGRHEPMSDDKIYAAAHEQAGTAAERAYLEEHVGTPEKPFTEKDFNDYQAQMKSFSEANRNAKGRPPADLYRFMDTHEEALNLHTPEGTRTGTEVPANTPKEGEGARAGTGDQINDALANFGKPGAEAVTATVKTPGLEPAKRLLASREDLSPQAKTDLLKKLDTATPAQVSKIYNRLRRSRPVVNGLGVQARDAGDLARKTGALDAAQKAFDQFPPKSNNVAVSTPDRVALLERLKSMVDAAGPEALAYKANEMPAAMQLVRAASKIVKSGKLTPKQAADFYKTETQLRSGKEEAVRGVQSENRVEADIAMSRRSGDEAIDHAQAQQVQPFAEEDAAIARIDAKKFPGETPPEEGEEGRTPQTISNKEDLMKSAGSNNKEPIDISKMTDEQRSDLAHQMSKVSENLIKVADSAEGGWKSEVKSQQDATAAKTAALREARLAKQNAAKVLSDVEGRIAKSMEAVEAAKTESPQPFDDMHSAVEPSLKDVAKEFLSNDGGALNIARINSEWRTRARPLKRWVFKTFGAPDTNLGLEGDTLVATLVSTKAQHMNAEVVRFLGADWHSWNKLSTDDGLKFLQTMEAVHPNDPVAFKADLLKRGFPKAEADNMTARAGVYRAMLDQAYLMEKSVGSRADFVKNYVPHVFKDAAGAQTYINNRIKQLGPTWFQKERSFELIADAVKNGFELKHDNTADLLTHRMAASFDMVEMQNLLTGMHAIGGAYPTRIASADRALNQRTKDWSLRMAPNGEEWRISPDVEPTVINGIEAKGLWGAENTLGSAFRGWMKVKNVWSPIKLAASGFHMIHEAGVMLANNIARAMSETGFANKIASLPKALRQTGSDLVMAWPIDKLPYEGKDIQHAWDIPYAQQTPMQRLYTGLVNEAGWSPQLSAQLRVDAGRDFAKALQNNDYVKLLPAALRRGIEKVQAPMFEHWIPNVKAASFMRDAEQLFRKYPDLINNPKDRALALRALGKQTDDRMGEMFYGSLFWNRYLKDTAIGSFLSLGWNLGQVRQAGGAVHNLLTKTGGRGTHDQQVIYNATNKGAYVASYTATAMMAAGAMSYALSGVLPSGMDWVFPQAGGKNPDGSPRRLSTMFNTREPVMAAKHIEERGVLGGLTTLLWNKMVLSPIVDAFQNKNFFGAQLYDPDAPWFKKVPQFVDSTLENLSPIAVTGAQRATDQGGGTRDKVLSYAGFGPAPAYISKSAMQNRIGYAYDTYVATTKPYEQSGSGLISGMLGNKPPSEAVRMAMGALNRAAQDNDSTGMAAARQALIKAGMNPKTVGKVQPGLGDVAMFNRLPKEVQQSLAKDMSQPEFVKYVATNSRVPGVLRGQMIQARTKP